MPFVASTKYGSDTQDREDATRREKVVIIRGARIAARYFERGVGWFVALGLECAKKMRHAVTE